MLSSIRARLANLVLYWKQTRMRKATFNALSTCERKQLEDIGINVMAIEKGDLRLM